MKKALKITFIAIFFFVLYKSNPDFYKAFKDNYVLISLTGIAGFGLICNYLEKRITKKY